MVGNLKSSKMKTRLAILLCATLLASCTTKQDHQPLTGTAWGEIPNASAEQVRSAEVIDWTADRGRGPAECFYDFQAVDGTKSLTIFSSKPAYGRWYTRVNVKPWSVYEFTGWIKTENLDTLMGQGAGFNLSAHWREFEFTEAPQFFAGTHDWTEVKLQFSTGDQDCLVLECLFNSGGRASGQAWFDNMKLKLIQSESLHPDIRIDLAKESEPIPVYIYGQFIEHLDRCIYGGI